MSERMHNVGTGVDVDPDFAFQVTKVMEHIAQLQFSGERLELNPPSKETIELNKSLSVAGVCAFVVRQRHFKSYRENISEDVYFALRPDVASVPLLVLHDDLSLENSWVAEGAFEKIKPRRDALTTRVAFGDTYPDVAEGRYDDIRELSRLLHGAVAQS